MEDLVNDPEEAVAYAVDLITDAGLVATAINDVYHWGADAGLRNVGNRMACGLRQASFRNSGRPSAHTLPVYPKGPSAQSSGSSQCKLYLWTANAEPRQNVLPAERLLPPDDRGGCFLQ
jgi:hypothetical protein